MGPPQCSTLQHGRRLTDRRDSSGMFWRQKEDREAEEVIQPTRRIRKFVWGVRFKIKVRVRLNGRLGHLGSVHAPEGRLGELR